MREEVSNKAVACAFGNVYAFPEDPTLEVTVTGLQSKYYDLDLSAFDMKGIVHALYFDAGGTISFNKDVSLSSIDPATLATTAHPCKAGEVYEVADINEWSLAFATSANSLCFVSVINAINYAALTPDKDVAVYQLRK